jgi:hypothetical protein
MKAMAAVVVARHPVFSCGGRDEGEGAGTTSAGGWLGIINSAATLLIHRTAQILLQTVRKRQKNQHPPQHQGPTTCLYFRQQARSTLERTPRALAHLSHCAHRPIAPSLGSATPPFLAPRRVRSRKHSRKYSSDHRSFD